MTEPFWLKLGAVASMAMAGMHPAHRAECVAECHRRGEYGVIARRVGEAVELVWGGTLLAVIYADNLADDDAPLHPMEFVRGMADTIPDDWDDPGLD